MSQQLRSSVALLLVFLVGLTGCHPTQPFYAHSDGDLSHYIDRATEMRYPDIAQATFEEADGAVAPLNILDPEFDRFWDLTLEEVIATALQNNKVIRNLASVTPFGVADGLVNRTLAASTVYDPALSETSTLGGSRPVDRATGSVFATEPNFQATQQGVEDALSEFDAQLFSSVNYGTTDRPRNVQTGNPFNPVFFEQQNGNFLGALSKKTAGGNIYSFRNRTAYTRNNIPIGIGRALPSDWQTEFEVEAQFPLMRGRGEQINRIPVVLASINSDISIMEVEVAVRNQLLDIENTYWDLYAAYRNLQTTRIGYDSAQLTWRNTNEKVAGGLQGRRLEAQSRDQYYFFLSQLQRAQHDLFQTERKLRWLMGITPTDGRVIRPIDEPIIAEVSFEWLEIKTEAVFRTAELIQQKWRITQRELELKGAKNQLLPRLNATVGYRWLGLGDDLVNADRNGINFPDEGSTAFDELFEGDFQEATLGLEFTPPQFGARRPLAAIQHARFELSRAKSQLDEMELNQVHNLSDAVSNAAQQYAQTVTTFNRLSAAREDVEMATALFEGGKEDLDQVLQAQRSRAQAQIELYRSIAEYNKAIASIHFFKGSLLQYNGIQLAEGPWPQKAYWDAVEQARARDASYFLHYGWTRPEVISQGPIDQGVPHDMMLDAAPTHDGAEEVPAPQPTPAEPDSESETLPGDPQESPMNEDVPPARPDPGAPMTRRPQGPSLEAPTQAAKRPSSRRQETHSQPNVVPTDLEEPVGTGVSSNPLRQANYDVPALR